MRVHCFAYGCPIAPTPFVETPFFIELPWHPSPESGVCICVGLLLNRFFHSVDLCAYPFVNNTLY